MLVQHSISLYHTKRRNDKIVDSDSAMLHVKSANKGLLIPQITLIGINDAATIPTPAALL